MFFQSFKNMCIWVVRKRWVEETEESKERN